jgi:hypothetical protein
MGLSTSLFPVFNPKYMFNSQTNRLDSAQSPVNIEGGTSASLSPFPWAVAGACWAMTGGGGSREGGGLGGRGG